MNSNLDRDAAAKLYAEQIDALVAGDMARWVKIAGLYPNRLALARRLAAQSESGQSPHYQAWAASVEGSLSDEAGEWSIFARLPGCQACLVEAKSLAFAAVRDLGKADRDPKAVEWAYKLRLDAEPIPFRSHVMAEAATLRFTRRELEAFARLQLAARFPEGR